MSSREDRPREWRREPEASSASGGHIAPEVDPAGPLFDPLVDPLPSERAGESGLLGERSRSQPADRTARRTDPADVLPSPERTRPMRREAAARSAPRPRTGARRVKRTVKHIDPLSVLKLSLFYYAIFLVFWLVFVAILYSIIDGMGLFDAIESFGQGFALDWGELDISLMFVERWAFFIGLTMAIVGSLVNAFLAFLYNIGSDLVGGVEVTFSERDA